MRTRIVLSSCVAFSLKWNSSKQNVQNRIIRIKRTYSTSFLTHIKQVPNITLKCTHQKILFYLLAWAVCIQFVPRSLVRLLQKGFVCLYVVWSVVCVPGWKRQGLSLSLRTDIVSKLIIKRSFVISLDQQEDTEANLRVPPRPQHWRFNSWNLLYFFS